MGFLLWRTLKDWIRAEKNEKVRKRLCSLEVLLLDEVSMLSSDFLDRASRLVAWCTSATMGRWEDFSGNDLDGGTRIRGEKFH